MLFHCVFTTIHWFAVRLHNNWVCISINGKKKAMSFTADRFKSSIGISF